MNRAQAQAIVRETFTTAFDKNLFLKLTANLVNHLDDSKASAWNSQYVKDAFKEHIARYERLGTFTSPQKETLDVLIVHLTRESKLERVRTAIRNFVADHLKTRDEKDAALVAFVSPTEQQWRFSYVKMEYAATETASGKVGVETKLTPARRFSYIVGVGESCHTAQTRFLDLLQNTESDPTLADIEEAFSVEAVTKEFFQKYAELFEDIQKQLDKLLDKDRTLRDDFKAKSIGTVDFAKKLLGQIVFLYFLQKKGWLGVAKNADWGTGPRDFMRRLVNGEHGKYDHFFNDILEPLFYDSLATDRGSEAWSKHFNCRIPFLNGGLFEPIGDYDWRKTDIVLPNRLFTNNEPVEEGIRGTGVFDVFDRYNFTVNEAEPLEKEVAIDPEMLGKVFENLIEENRRKGLGAFYTPREIVHYMCQESLINYLDTAMNGASAAPVIASEAKQSPIRESEIASSQSALLAMTIPRADLETFVHLGEQISHYESVPTEYKVKMPKSIEPNARRLDDALADITVCDPAVGSGAFPVGMMTEIVRARTALTPYFPHPHPNPPPSDNSPTREGVTPTPALPRAAGEGEKRTPYHFKRHAIRNCLYGVDVDAGAVEIAKLRLWLSLVVDEEDVKEIKPLPNLDYKIVAGNSLLGFPFKSQKMGEVEKLKQEFFDETDHDKKAKLKAQVDELLTQVFAASKKSLGYEVNFDFRVFFSEVFKKGNGFDVTIGNPPYVRADAQEEEHKLLRERIKASKQYQTLWEKWDLYVPFIELAYKLLEPNGVTTMIVSDAYCHSKYAQKSQTWFLQNSRVRRLDFLSKIQIFDAAVRNIIYQFQKADGANNEPERRVHDPEFGAVKLLPTAAQSQLTYRAFFPEDTVAQQFSSPTMTLEQICYITKGMVVHADEDLARGEFELSDLVSNKRDKLHSKPFVEGKHLERWLPRTHKWLEWGTKRAPALFSRPTFPELYAVEEKLISVDMAAGVEKLRVVYDDRQLYHNHSAWSFVPWHSLAGVRNNSIKKTTRYHNEKPPRADLPRREELEKTGRRFAVKFLLAVMNSSAARDFLRAKRRSNIHLYPEDWKKLPIPDIPAERQTPIVKLVDCILAAKKRDPDADTSAWEREIDQLVYQLYGLTEEEIEVVEGG